MNAHLVDIKRSDDEKEKLETLLNMMGTIDGGCDSPEFQAMKEDIMNSGISYEDLSTMFSENLMGAMSSRPEVDVNIQLLTEDAKTPTYSHPNDAGADVYANETITIEAGKTTRVSTGIAVAAPIGYMINAYPRSGMSEKTPLRISNSVGVIDSDYRGEVKILFTNIGTESYTIIKGERIAQLVICQSPRMRWIPTEDINSIEGNRNGGFGSSGK